MLRNFYYLRFIRLILIACIVFSMSCVNREHTNPVDPNNDLSSYTPSPNRTITDVIEAKKDATLEKRYITMPGYSPYWRYENDQDYNEVGTHGAIVLDTAIEFFYRTLIYFGDIKSIVQTRNKQVKGAYIIFHLRREPPFDFDIYESELVTPNWNESQTTSSPDTWPNSTYHTTPNIENDKCTIGMYNSIQLILNSSRNHGGFILYSEASWLAENYFSFSTSEDTDVSKRPKLVIEYE